MLGNIIRESRKNLAMTQLELANKMGVTQGAVASWENDTRLPSTEKLINLAKVLNISVESLTTGNTDNSRQKILGGIRRIKPSVEPTVYRPLLGRVHAGDATTPDIIDDAIPLAESIAVKHPNSYFLQVEGNCMNRVYAEGDYVLIDPDIEPKNGSIAVVIIDRAECVMRRLYNTGQTLILSPESYDESYKDIVFTHDSEQVIEIVGTVVWYQAACELG